MMRREAENLVEESIRVFEEADATVCTLLTTLRGLLSEVRRGTFDHQGFKVIKAIEEIKEQHGKDWALRFIRNARSRVVMFQGSGGKGSTELNFLLERLESDPNLDPVGAVTQAREIASRACDAEEGSLGEGVEVTPKSKQN